MATPVDTKVHKPKKGTAPTLSELEKAARGINLGIGSPGTGGTSATPSQLGLTAAESTAPVVFSIPGGHEEFAAPKGATLNAKGQLVATVAELMQAYFTLDKEQLKFFQDQMVNGHLISAKYATGEPNQQTQNAWKRVALDSANSGSPFTSLVNMGASSGDYANLLAGIQSDIATEQRQVAETKTGTYTYIDPNQIGQSLDAAFASIGEPPPSPAFRQQFINAYAAKEGEAEQGVLEAQKQDFAGALGTLESERNAVEQGNPGELNKLQSGSLGTVSAIPKPDFSTTGALDAETMAQAKAADPAEYYATQSSYLYGLLLDDIRGTPTYQTAPTAPSQTAPGGPVVGTPLIGG